MVTPEQKKVLEEHFIEFAYFEKADKFNIAFLPETTEVIKALLHNKQQAPKETAQHRNSRIYAGLKKNEETVKAALTSSPMQKK